jgi:hypothetical protein
VKSAHLVALTLLLVSVERAASASPAVAKPFGIEIGKTTCREAISLIHGAVPEKVDDKGSILISMQEPGQFYAGTIKGSAYCMSLDSPVDFFSMMMVVKGQGSVGVNGVYDALSSKYLLARGGLPEMPGKFAATFEANGSIVEFTSKGDEFMSIKYKALDLKPSDRVGTSSGARAASRNVKSPL